jgi:predicted transposase YbfD/YdcC
MGCQTEIASQIQAKKADYVIALKENQKTLYRHATDWFAHAEQTQFRLIPHHDYAQVINKGHGRVEVRDCWVISDTPVIQEFREQQGWVGLRSIVKIRRQRTIQGVTTEQISYYISSLTQDALTILTAVRRHWAIENECHWVLDVIFDEDRSRIRLGESPQNFSLIRKIALSILKQDTSKGSLNAKRFKAALSDDFRLALLRNFHA